jgi:fructose-bisphosphate aldolase class II
MLVTGQRLLEVAQREGFAVPAYNTGSFSIFNAVLRQCEADKTPWFAAIHRDELAHTGPAIVAGYLEAARAASVPIAVHLDHGVTFSEVIAAIRRGYSSVMIDASNLPFEDNAALTAKVVEAAHDAGVSVEAELGSIGRMAHITTAGNETIIYTDPPEAAAFLAQTGCDSLAVSIGTSHGLYPRGTAPKLRLDLLAEIAAAAKVPLVLHGGSGNPDAEIAQAVGLGIAKINISSDIKRAYYDALIEALAHTTAHEPAEIEPAAENALAEVVHAKNQLFNAVGRAPLY